MNFCSECGADLRDNQTAKFCYSCGNQLTITGNLTTNYFEDNNEVKTDIDQEDNFDYFDFPDINHFDDFMLEVGEHIATENIMSNIEIAQKYFERGEDLFEAQTIYFEIFAKLRNPNAAELDFDEVGSDYFKYLIDNQDEFIEKTFQDAVNCYKASLYFSNCKEAYYQLFVCYQYGKDYKRAHKNLIFYAETCRESFGLSDKRTSQAVDFCVNNYLINQSYKIDLNLPDWMNLPL